MWRLYVLIGVIVVHNAHHVGRALPTCVDC